MIEDREPTRDDHAYGNFKPRYPRSIHSTEDLDTFVIGSNLLRSFQIEGGKVLDVLDFWLWVFHTKLKLHVLPKPINPTQMWPQTNAGCSPQSSRRFRNWMCWGLMFQKSSRRKSIANHHMSMFGIYFCKIFFDYIVNVYQKYILRIESIYNVF